MTSRAPLPLPLPSFPVPLSTTLTHFTSPELPSSTPRAKIISAYKNAKTLLPSSRPVFGHSSLQISLRISSLRIGVLISVVVVMLKRSEELFGRIPFCSFSLSSSSTQSVLSSLKMASTGGCVVCGKECMMRCSECAKGGIDWMYFCSSEHQKLASPLQLFEPRA